MRNALRFEVSIAVFLFLAGCASESTLKEILDDILPSNSQIVLVQSCSEFMGPAVALFTYEAPQAERNTISHDVEGIWICSYSLQEFAEADALEYEGAGVAATILDGKKCLQDLTDEGEKILFQAKGGLYFRSENRQVVAGLFDEPEGHGVIFLQAP